MFGKKNENDWIGKEQLTLLDEYKSYSEDERIKLFKIMSRIEAKTWKKHHHLKRIIGDITVFNFNIYVVYKTYYRLCNPLLSFYQSIIQSTSLKLIYTTLGIFDLCYTYYSYLKLPKEIYYDCYASLSDKEFIQLYNYVTNPRIKSYKSI